MKIDKRKFKGGTTRAWAGEPLEPGRGNQGGRLTGKGMYDNEAEAMSRAVEIGCSTVHQNNGRWMPCSDERELHQQMRKQ